MPAGTLGAAFPKDGIEDILEPLNNGKEKRKAACVKTEYLLNKTAEYIVRYE